jgi:hypothetical protein
MIERVVKVEIEVIFYNSGGSESDGLRRVAGGGGVDSMPQFRLKRGDDGMKHC